MGQGNPVAGNFVSDARAGQARKILRAGEAQGFAPVAKYNSWYLNMKNGNRLSDRTTKYVTIPCCITLDIKDLLMITAMAKFGYKTANWEWGEACWFPALSSCKNGL
jgi:hypothetical protein